MLKDYTTTFAFDLLKTIGRKANPMYKQMNSLTCQCNDSCKSSYRLLTDPADAVDF